MPEHTDVCEPLWTESPGELLKLKFDVNNLCESDNINAFTRGCLLGLLIGLLLFPFLEMVGLAVILLCLVILYGRWIFAKINPSQRISVKEDKPGRSAASEGFLAYEGAQLQPTGKDQGAFATAPVITSPGVVTRPTAVNPFMNVLLDEISYNPTRPAADFATDPNNQAVLDDFFRVQWTSDPTDVFGRAQSQREFYTMPSTSIPNDQESYQNWLYLIPGKTCKEGGRDACYPATNGSPIVSLSKPN